MSESATCQPTNVRCRLICLLGTTGYRQLHSITWSAIESSEAGRVRLSIRAVWWRGANAPSGGIDAPAAVAFATGKPTQSGGIRHQIDWRQIAVGQRFVLNQNQSQPVRKQSSS